MSIENIGAVLMWKFPALSGVATRGGVIIEFPPDVPDVDYVEGIPSQANQDTWAAEYALYKGKVDQIEAIDEAEAAAVAAGFEYTFGGKTLVFELTAEYVAVINALEKTSNNGNVDLEVGGTNKATGWPDIFAFTKAELKTFTQAYEGDGAQKKRNINRAKKAVGDS